MTQEGFAIRYRFRKLSDFGLLWTGSSVSLFGSECASTAGPLLALFLTQSPIFAGWIVVAQTAPTLLLPLVAGAVADRFDRHRTMVVCQTGRLLTAALLFVTLLAGAQPEPLILLWALADGAFFMVYTTAETAIVPQLVPSHRLSKALADIEARGHVALLGGRPLGGLLFNIAPAWPYIVEFFSSAVSLVTLLLMRSRPSGRLGTSTAMSPLATTEGFRRIWSDVSLRSAVVFCTATNFVFQVVVILLVMRAQAKGVSPVEAGLLLGAPSVGGLIASRVAPGVIRRLFGNRLRAVLLPCVLGWLAVVLVIALSEQTAVWYVAWACVGFLGVHVNVALSIHQAEQVPPYLLGRVASANRFLTLGVVLPAGALAGGYGIERLGPDTTSLVVILVMVVLAFAAVAQRVAGRRGYRPLPVAGVPAGPPTTGAAGDTPRFSGERTTADV